MRLLISSKESTKKYKFGLPSLREVYGERAEQNARSSLNKGKTSTEWLGSPVVAS